MSPTRSKIPRHIARQLGEEALQISRLGHYQAPSGRDVDLRSAIAEAIEGTVSYPPSEPIPLPERSSFNTVLEVREESTLAAGHRLLDEGYNPVLLNFASATHPGGGFLLGGRAQEEGLAWSSALYLCLEDSPMYPFHREQPDPLYTDYAIYSPGVPVFRGDDHQLLDEPFRVAFITSAAPNRHELPAHRHGEVEGAMRGRIRRVLSLGRFHGHDAIVLGAWGCGAFGNDPRLIAHLFRESTEEDAPGAYRKIVFAILDHRKGQPVLGAFREVLALN